MNIYQLLEAILEELADGRQEGESITDYKKRKADELEKHFTNKEEEAKTKARVYNHQYKKEKKEWKNNPQIGAEKALDTADKALNNIIKSSDARRKKWEVQGIKKKMSKNEALELMEAIINEVSVKRWKEAAANSLDKRKEAADITAKNAEQTWDDYDRISRKHPEDEPQLYRLAQANDEVAGKAEDSADHAYAVTRLRTHDKANANKAIKAARKVADKRDDEFSKKLNKRTFLRMGKADQLVSADPVKSRTDEALEIMENIVKQVEKKYGKLFDGKINARGRDLHKQVIANDVNEIISAAKRNLPDEEKNSSLAIDKEYDKIQNKRTSNKNKVGQAKTDARRPGSLHDQMQEIKNRKEDAAKGHPKAIEKSIKRHDKKMDEALELMEQIVDFADNLFELDLEQKQNISPNKVSRVKKDKNGEKVEVVSVADELFPYEGDAKQQFNQKVLAKINDMIEGTGSLEDLIQFVRKGVAMKKQSAHEEYEGVISVLENIHDGEGKLATNVLNRRQVKEALEILEGFINELKDETIMSAIKKRTDRATNAHRQAGISGGRAVDAKTDNERVKHLEDVAKHLENRNVQVQKGTRAGQLAGKRMKDPEKKKELVSYIQKSFAKAADDAEKFSKGMNNYEVGQLEKHKEKLGKLGNAVAAGEKGAKKQYSKQRNVVGNIEDDLKAKGVPHTSVTGRKWNGNAYEALEEIKNVAEGLFKKDERGDLLDDIDTTLGSPVKKKLADIKAKMTGCKETKVHEALDLMEEIINEVSVGKLYDAAKSSLPKREQASKVASDAEDIANSKAHPYANKIGSLVHDKDREEVIKTIKNNPESQKAAGKRREAYNRESHARKIVNGLKDVEKADSTTKYTANANDFVKKLNRINRKKKEKEQKEWAGTFPERKQTRTEFQAEISSDDGSEGANARKLRKEKYEKYINPVKRRK